MRSLLACLLLTGCATATHPPTLIAPTPLQLRQPESAAPVASCGELGGFVQKWQQLLALRDWTVTTSCAPIPEKENAAAISYTDAWHRTIEIVVGPGGDDGELIVIHELAHALFTMTCEAKSDVVEEQIVVTLSELLRRLEKGKP